jgi:alpha,alpha-trehalase
VLESISQDRARELREKLNLSDEELQQWDAISRRMRILFHGNGIISQFEGYDVLEEFDREAYKEKYGDIQRLDRILEKENDTPNRYKMSKQADVLMLFYLFSSEELEEILHRLGYPFENETIPRNIGYYMERTCHGSTLSRVVHSWVLVRSDRPRSWKLFNEALQSDVTDIQGGTPPEGIHLGAMAGTVDLIQRAYTGIVVRQDVLWFNPCLPEEVRSLEMCVRYRGHALDIAVASDRLNVTLRPSGAEPIRIGVKDKVYKLKAGDTGEFAL